MHLEVLNNLLWAGGSDLPPTPSILHLGCSYHLHFNHCFLSTCCAVILVTPQVESKNNSNEWKATKVHVYVQYFSLWFFPSLRGLTEVWHHSLKQLLNYLLCKRWGQELIHGNCTGPYTCHQWIGPRVTQNITIAKLAILTWKVLLLATWLHDNKLKCPWCPQNWYHSCQETNLDQVLSNLSQSLHYWTHKECWKSFLEAYYTILL